MSQQSTINPQQSTINNMPHPSLDPRWNYDSLQRLIASCHSFLDWPEDQLFMIKADVSGWSIASHLHHLARAHGAIPRLIERLKTGRLGEEGLEGRPEALQLIYDGIILRGRQSPDISLPDEDLTHEKVIKDFGRMTNATQRLEPVLDELHTYTFSFPHLYYGPLNALEWLRFMGMHTRHHLGIMREIELSLKE